METEPTTIADIPDELVTHIFSFLTTAELTSNVPRVSQRFHTLSNEDLLWKGFVDSVVGTYLPPHLLPEQGWKKFYYESVGFYGEGLKSSFIDSAGETISAISYHRETRLLLTGSYSSLARCYKESTDHTLAEPSSFHTDTLVWAVDTYDGQQMVVGCDGSTMAELWDIETQKKLLRLSNGASCGVQTARIRDNIVVSGDYANDVAMFDTRASKPELWREQTEGAVMFTQFDDTRLILCNCGTQMMEYDRRSMKQPVTQYNGYDGEIWCLYFDDKYLYGCGQEGRFCVHQLGQPDPILEWDGDASYCWLDVQFSSVALCDRNGTVHGIQLNSAKEEVHSVTCQLSQPWCCARNGPVTYVGGGDGLFKLQSTSGKT